MNNEEFDRWFDETIRNTVKSPIQLIHLIKKHSDKFLLNAGYDSKCSNFDIRVLSMFSTKVHNTERCPVDGVINWRRNADLPMFYMAFAGKVELVCECQSVIDFSKLRHVHFLTGGYVGGDSYTYSSYIFHDDYPLMKEEIEKLKILKILQGDTQPDKLVGCFSELNKMYP